MKKILLYIGFVFLGLQLNAQNQSDASQTGQHNLATVNQQGQNKSSVQQEFTANTATVSQFGHNDSSINQSGNVDGNSTSGNGNDAQVLQNGGNLAEQKSTLEQQGNDNVAQVMQWGNDNQSSVQQGTNGQAENNEATVFQMGLPIKPMFCRPTTIIRC